MQAYAPAHTRGRLRWWIANDLDPVARARLDPILSDPDAALASPASVARRRVGRKRFYHLRQSPTHIDGPPQLGLFIKIFEAPRGGAGWLRSFGESRATREAEVATAILQRGFLAAAPIAVGEERRLGRRTRSVSIIPELPARDLRTLLLDPAMTCAKRRELIEQFGRFTARLHASGIDQDDTSPNNFLVSTAGDFILIDFERCRVGEVLPPMRRWHLLAKLQRHQLGVTYSDRLRFLRAYLEDTPEISRRAAWSQISARLLEVRRNDARRAERGAFQEGRLLERIGAEWQVRGREQISAREIELPRKQAQQQWVLALQLERLRLPALRPVRLTRTGIVLASPVAVAEEAQRDTPRERTAPPGAGPADSQHTAETERRIVQACREFERFGSWRAAPRWEADGNTVWLADLTTFELAIPTSDTER